MNQDHELKSQRDRFLAFSFAGADLLLEIDQSGKIVFAMGATKSILNMNEKELLGTAFLKIFSEKDKSLMLAIQNSDKVAQKQGPYLVTIVSPKDKAITKHVFLNCFRLSKDGYANVSISLGDSIIKMMGAHESISNTPHILNADNFEKTLRKKLAARMDSKLDTNVQILELSNIDNLQKELEGRNWSDFMTSLGQVIMSSSIDGDSAVKIDDGKYMFLKDSISTESILNEKITSLAKSYDVDIPLNFDTRNIATNSDTLNSKEVSRAIMYTLKKLENSSIRDIGDNLKDSFEDYLKENASKIIELKKCISRQEFKIFFQPIVSLSTHEISHHEVLMRFDKETSPYELIVMGEEVGIAADVDLAVCRQTIKYIDMNKHKKLGKLAVNISGSSIQNDIFMNSLSKILKEYPKESEYLIFEITESSEIKDLGRVNKFIQSLRESNHMVCLDDFGSGAASFQYLQKMEVDGVKIDGSFVKEILVSPRYSTMVKNITKMCHELNIYVVAEMIETKAQEDLLLSIGVDKGQGWLYSKAMPDVLNKIIL